MENEVKNKRHGQNIASKQRNNRKSESFNHCTFIQHLPYSFK